MTRADCALNPAFVLHARPYRESSFLVELLVLGVGRVGAVARGVRGVRAAGRKALLQPLQPLQVSLQQRGELAVLSLWEASSQPIRLRGDALLAALYVNELCQRLLPRDELLDTFFVDYAHCLADLAEQDDLATPLRRIELALLAVAGYGLDPEVDARGTPIDGAGRYWLDDDGDLIPTAQTARPSVSGQVLLGVGSGIPAPPVEAAALRRLLRSRLAHALGPKPLRCWGMLDELAELRSGTMRRA